MSGFSAAHMKESRKGGIKETQKVEKSFIVHLFHFLDIVDAQTQPSRTQVTKSLSCILTNTYADGRQKIRDLIHHIRITEFIASLRSLLAFHECKHWARWESIATIKISLRAECAECSHLFIRQRIDRSLSKPYFKRNDDIGRKSAFDLEAGFREGLFSFIAFQMPFGLEYAPRAKEYIALYSKNAQEGIKVYRLRNESLKCWAAKKLMKMWWI